MHFKISKGFHLCHYLSLPKQCFMNFAAHLLQVLSPLYIQVSDTSNDFQHVLHCSILYNMCLYIYVFLKKEKRLVGFWRKH
jgi:hypothetical protein